MDDLSLHKSHHPLLFSSLLLKVGLKGVVALVLPVTLGKRSGFQRWDGRLDPFLSLFSFLLPTLLLDLCPPQALWVWSRPSLHSLPRRSVGLATATASRAIRKLHVSWQGRGRRRCLWSGLHGKLEIFRVGSCVESKWPSFRGLWVQNPRGEPAWRRAGGGPGRLYSLLPQPGLRE